MNFIWIFSKFYLIPLRILIIFQVKASDNDFGQYGTLSYEIFGDDMLGLFTIDKTTGALYAKDILDREEKSFYEVIVKATDGGGKIGYTVVKIKIGDLNDNVPSFLLKDYKIVVKEDTPINSVIGKVSNAKIRKKIYIYIFIIIIDNVYNIINNIYNIIRYHIGIWN